MLSFTISNLWMMVCIVLVFIMHLGFAMLEIGLTRSKNTINILFKNMAVIIIGLLAYTFMGFGMMYSGPQGGIFHFGGFGLRIPLNAGTPQYNPYYTFWTDFLFQAMFAATAASIVSGAVAERIKLSAFLWFSFLYVTLIYPVVGYWHWGKGWLSGIGFHDFAGSTIIHSVGGWAALIGILFLGPRIGKYNGKVSTIEGHSIPLATMGVLLLWFGWFGFNGGSVLSADPGKVSKVLVITTLSATSGVVGAFFSSYLLFRTYDITMVINGILAGLVGITAGADIMGVTDALVVGLISGILVVLAIVGIDRLKIDDPVGAVPVHMVCGLWGTLAVGIFGEKAGLKQLFTQIVGIFSVGIFCALGACVIFIALRKFIGLRVSEKEEHEGLDINEHSMRAYPDFRANQH